jgi:hypothetical protein
MVPTMYGERLRCSEGHCGWCIPGVYASTAPAMAREVFDEHACGRGQVVEICGRVFASAVDCPGPNEFTDHRDHAQGLKFARQWVSEGPARRLEWLKARLRDLEAKVEMAKADVRAAESEMSR